MRGVWVSVVAALVLVGGCSGGGKGDGAAGAEIAREGGKLTIEAIEARSAAAARLEYPLARKLMIFSGMDEALGGATRAELALQGTMALLRDQTAPQREEVARLVRIQHDPSHFGGLGLSMSSMTATLGGYAGAALLDGTMPPASEQTGPVRVSMTDGRVEVTGGGEGVVDGLASKVSTKISYDQCPAADGKVTVTFMSDTRLSAGETGGNLKVTVQGEMQYDEDGRLVESWSAETRVENAAFGPKKGTFIDASFDREGGMKINNRSSQATDADVEMVDGLKQQAEFAAASVLRAAEKAVAAGQCVRLQPTSTPAKRTGAKPKTDFVIDARPRSVIDGAATGGSVVATLSGAGALDRAGAKVPADAQYRYVGPDTDKEGAITFEARSKRGVGKAVLKFDARSRAYGIAGGAGEFHGTGVICDLNEPFEVTGSGVVVSFSPSGGTGGSYSYKGTMSGFGVHGTGTYTVSATEGGGTLTATGPGTVVTPMGSRSAVDSEHYTLTPRPPC